MFWLNKQRRINHSPVQYHTPVQVRAGGAAGHAGETQLLALADRIAGVHIELVKMAVHGEETVTVVDKNGFAVEEIVIHRQYGAGCAGLEGGAAWYCNIQARMG